MSSASLLALSIEEMRFGLVIIVIDYYNCLNYERTRLFSHLFP
jgi:hypothetical protein